MSDATTPAGPVDPGAHGAAGAHAEACAPLELEGYGVAFGDLVVLRGLDLRVGEGDRVVALLGAAHSGRTTLLRSLAGLNRADPTFREWGVSRMLGRPLGDGHRPPLALSMAAEPMTTPRDVLLQPLRRVADEATGGLAAALQPMPWDEIACDALAEHGLVSLVERLHEPLRGIAPMHRRALGVLAHALLAPPLLLVDDPLIGLDDASCVWLVDWLVRLGRRQRMIVAIDRPELARRLDGQPLRLEGGRLAVLPDAPASPKPFAIDDPAEAAFRRTSHIPSPWLHDDDASADSAALFVDDGVDTRSDPPTDTVADTHVDTRALELDRRAVSRVDALRSSAPRPASEPGFASTVVLPHLPPPSD